MAIAGPSRICIFTLSGHADHEMAFICFICWIGLPYSQPEKTGHRVGPFISKGLGLMLFYSLETLKFASILLALVSGMIASLTDFRTKDHKISRGGKATIFCILLAGLIGASSEAIDIAKQRKEDDESRVRL